MTSLRHSLRGISSPRSAYCGRPDLGELVVVGQRRWRGVEGAAPEHELLLAVLLQRLLLVLALEGAVVALVEAPGAAHRDPVPVGGVEGQRGRGDRSPLQRGVHDVGQQAGLDEQLAAADRLGAALVGQVDVDPAGEEVLGVPLALAVAEQDQGVGHSTAPAVAQVRALDRAGVGPGLAVGGLGGGRRAVGRRQLQRGRELRRVVLVAGLDHGHVERGALAAVERHRHGHEVAGDEVAGDGDAAGSKRLRARPVAGTSTGVKSDCGVDRASRPRSGVSRRLDRVVGQRAHEQAGAVGAGDDDRAEDVDLALAVVDPVAMVLTRSVAALKPHEESTGAASRSDCRAASSGGAAVVHRQGLRR